MSFLELARKRCSIRKYAPKNVEQEKIDYILEAARLAPFGGKLSTLVFCMGSKCGRKS